ncbi:MAG: hypothetical protein L6R39_001936 [Caloplaca ligustica]|nr:MAG: hypothetical protein L6R39_001936 [Caloplaca ligustica]
MQKLLKRTAQVEKQAARRNRIRTAQNTSDERRLRIYQQQKVNEARRETRNSAKQAMKEDWHLGPLAPRRDVGDKAETYGTVHFRLIQAVEKPLGMRKKWGIREGDRVCVVGEKERDKGKIGVVIDVSEKAEACKVSVATPEYMKVQGRNEPPVQTSEAPIDLASVRLVIPLQDLTTGTKRDVIVNELTLTPTGQRCIANYISPHTGKAHYIPWPSKERPEFTDNDVDTLRIDVEQVTWTPTLLRSPMPSGVIDELRNKYSKFRTRHEDSYIEMKEGIDEKLKQREEELKWGGGTPREMLTPVQELNRARRMERRLQAEEENKLTDQVLAGIGEIMVKKGKKLPPKENEDVDFQPVETQAPLEPKVEALVT